MMFCCVLSDGGVMDKIKNINIVSQKFRKILLIVIWLISGALTACVLNTGSNDSKSEDSPTTQSIYFSDMGAIPIIAGSNASYQISLFNGTSSAVNINPDDVKLIGAKLKPKISIADIIDIKECSIIQAHGQCAIRVNLGDSLLDDTGEFGLQIASHQSKGEDLKATSVISYFTPNESTDLAYSTVGVGQFNIKESKLVNVNIPIYFMKDYTQVHIKNNNPNIKSELLDCKTEIFANTACTLRVSLMGGSAANGLVEFMGQLKSQSEANADTPLFSLSVSNEIQGTGHMLLGTTRSSIVEDGKDRITLTLVNNGNGMVKDLKANIDSSSILKIDQNGCDQNLNIGADCEIVLTTNSSSAPLSIADLNFSYNDGQNTASLDHQIIVKPQNGQIGTIVTNISGDFINTPNEVSRTVTVSYSNNGNVAINNFKVEPSGSLPDGIRVYNNECLTKTTLAVGAKCDYVLEYKPQSIVSKNKFKILALAEYSSGEQMITIMSASNIEYSSYSSSGYIHFSPETLNFATLVNKSISKVVTIENYSDSDVENLAFTVSMSNKEHDANYKITKGLSETIANCFDKKNLKSHEACSLTVEFSPNSAYLKDAGILKADFEVNAIHVNNQLPIQSDAINGVAQVSITAITAKGQVLGSGKINDPYIFNTLNGNDGEIFIEYKNEGTVNLKNFSVSNILPIGYTVDLDGAKSSCPTNGNVGQLPVGQKCILAIEGYNPEINDFISKDSEINVAIPSVSYVDEDNRFAEQGNYGVIYSKFNALNYGSITVSPTFIEEVDGEIYYANTVTYKITNSDTRLPVKFGITSPQGSGDSVLFVSSTDNEKNYCNISVGQVGASCSVKMYYELLPVTISTRVEVNGLYWQYGVVVDNIPPPQAILTTATKNVDPNDSINIKFTNPITNLDSSTLHIKKGSEDGADINFTINGDSSNKEYKIMPQGLELATNYYIILSDNIVDNYQKHLEKKVLTIQTKPTNFITAKLVSPNVTVNVPRNTDIVIGFSGTIDDCSLLNNHIKLKQNDTDTLPISIVSGASKQTCKISLTQSLRSNAKYELIVDGNVNMSATSITAETHLSFSTNQDIVITPTLQGCSTNLNFQTVTLNVIFDHDVDPATVVQNNLEILYSMTPSPILPDDITKDSSNIYHITFGANQTGPGSYKLKLSQKVCDTYGACLASQSLGFKLALFKSCKPE